MLIDNLNRTIDTWISELRSYDFEKMLIKPDPESWSLGQVYMHIIEETSYYMEQSEICLGHNENFSEEMIENAKSMFLKNEFPDERVKGDPHISENVQQPISKLKLQQEMQELKQQMNNMWRDIIENKISGKTRHPGLGYFDAKEWIQYAEMHLRHHLRQKRRIDELLKTVAR